mmetsp:Transcript_19966/g.25153  ORF Transcript_19966/g.25153 Transcript_19966/m.25153 type:complete len:699 (+) Transcript_19966:104-2200(+)
MDDDEFEEYLDSQLGPVTTEKEQKKKKSKKKESNSSDIDSENDKKRKKKKAKERAVDSSDDEDLVIEGPEPPPSRARGNSNSSDSDSDSVRKRKKRRARSRSRSRSRSGSRERPKRRSRERDRRRKRERERDSSRERERRRKEQERREKERKQREKEREERMRRLEKERRQREKEREERQKEERRRREKERKRRQEREEKERERRRAERKKREKEEAEKRKKEEEEKKRKREEEGPTLTDIMIENPGMSMTEALQKLAEVNQARLAAKNAPVAVAAMAGVAAGAPGLTNLPGLSVPIQNPALTKPYRDLYIGNLPAGTTGPQLQEALGAIMNQMGLVTSPGNPILSTWLAQDGHYAFCEFRTVEEANNAITLSGIMLGNSTIKVGRPKSYTGPPVPDPKNPTLGLSQAQSIAATTNPAASLNMANVPPGVMAGAATNLVAGGIAAATAAPVVPGLLGTIPGLVPKLPALTGAAKPPASRVLMLTNLPQACDASQVEELVKPFGTVTRFNLLMDSEGNSKGTAVFEYEDIGAVEIATKGLNDLPIGDKKLMVQAVPDGMAEVLLKPVEIKPVGDENGDPTRVVCLTNMVTPEELVDDQEFEDIKEDVADECNKFGTVKSIEIPRPAAAGEHVPGLGKIFLEFADLVGASKARKSLAGRTFANKKVEATFYPEDLFNDKIFEQSDAGTRAPPELPQENID